MKTLFQIQLLLISFLLFSQKVIATGVPVFSGDDVEVWVFNACSADIASGKIDLRINSEDGPFQVIYYDENLNELKNISVQEDNGGEEDLDNLMAGDYRVKVINRNCGVLEIEVNVGAISNIEIRADISPICQFGTGRIIPEITGIVEPVTYTWSNGDLTKDITNLDAGSYSLSITDSRGCFKVVDFTLENSTSPFWFADNLEIIPPSTCSSTDGYIRAWRPSVVTGGVAPLTYLWSNGASTNSIGPVQQGIYTVTITGSDGCKGIKEQELLSENAIEIIHEDISNVCPGINDGRIVVIANHPATYYCEQLNYISTNGLELNNLFAGTYCISIVSLNNELCKIDRCYTVGDKIKDGNLNITGTVKKSCPGENNGTINLVISGGYSGLGYEVLWKDNVGYWTYASNLSPGVYSVTVSDVCGETSFQSFTVEEWNYAPITHEYKEELISGTKYIVNTINGGSGQFGFTWEYSNQYGSWDDYPFTTKDIESYYMARYGPRTRFTITDLVTGCTFVKIFECVEFNIDVVPTCPGFSAGSIRLAPRYNNNNLNYLWSNGQTTKDIINLPKGDYYVTVTRNNCVINLGPIKVLDTKQVEWTSAFTILENQSFNCGYNEMCNSQSRYVDYDESNPIHKDRLIDKNKSKITYTKVGCNEEEIYCPASNTTKKRTLPYVYQPDWDGCRWLEYCPNNNVFLGFRPGTTFNEWKVKNNMCIKFQRCDLRHPNTGDLRTKTSEIPDPGQCCMDNITAANVPGTNRPNSTIVTINHSVDSKVKGTLQILNESDQIMMEWKNIEFDQFERYNINVKFLLPGKYKIKVIQSLTECSDIFDEFNISERAKVCPVLQLDRNPIVGEWSLISKFETTFNAKIKVTDSQLNTKIDYGEKMFPKEPAITSIGNQTDFDPEKKGGVFFVIIEYPSLTDCINDTLRLITLPDGFQDDDTNYALCKQIIIDVLFDSLNHKFTYFAGQYQKDSVLSYTTSFDTLLGYYNEFTRHHIIWDSVRFVRYDSTRTVYYFGTDSTRSFITSVDSTGSVFTQWFENIRFLSCSPLSKKGIWHIVGYHITENKYYLYKFDKKFLTLHPTVIPNPDRGQTYSKFWSFGPAEYVSTIRSGQYTTMKFVSNAVPPMDVVLPHPFVVKTVVKWQNNQWLVTGDLNGTMVIGGDTIVTEEWTKSIFIWYDWTGTVIKYKVIESEDDRIITHVATDGFEKILFTGMTIDTIFNETLDSFTIETCIFGDTITIDGIPTLFKGHQPDLTSSVEAVLQEDQTFVRFYPNPFKSGINLRIDSPVLDKISLHVTNVLGTVVLTKDLNISEGRNEIYLQEFESLPGGLYTVWIKKSTGEKAFKVIKIE